MKPLPIGLPIAMDLLASRVHERQGRVEVIEVNTLDGYVALRGKGADGPFKIVQGCLRLYDLERPEGAVRWLLQERGVGCP